jgi:hypothetical protein
VKPQSNRSRALRFTSSSVTQLARFRIRDGEPSPNVEIIEEKSTLSGSHFSIRNVTKSGTILTVEVGAAGTGNPSITTAILVAKINGKQVATVSLIRF